MQWDKIKIIQKEEKHDQNHVMARPQVVDGDDLHT
jgi:hypothetical protein